MVRDYPLVLADRDRLILFSALGRPRLFRQARTWVDDGGIAWMGARLGATGVGCTWLGPGWVFDPQARQDRASDYAQRYQAMMQAGQGRHRLELTRVAHGLRLGHYAERVLWAVHRAALADGTSLLCLPDIWLARAVWEARGRPRHWRGDLMASLRGLTWLHVADWPAVDTVPAFGAGTALLHHVGDLRGTEDDACPDDCPERHGPRHHHFLVDVGPGFLGVLERFARPDGESGVRTYSFPMKGPKGDGPLLWQVGKTGRLVSVFLPALLGDPGACNTFTARQHRLLQVLIRETTRAPVFAEIKGRRRRREAVGEPEVFSGNLVQPFHGKKLVSCPLLDATSSHVGFNGNRRRKGLGYKLSTPGGWLTKAGYDPSDVPDFFNDLAALAGRLGLVVVGIDRSGQWFALERLQQLALTAPGLRVLEALHVRIYIREDYRTRWSNYFHWQEFVAAEQIRPPDVDSLSRLAGALKTKKLSLRRLAAGLCRHHSFVVRLMRGEKPWPEGLLAQALEWTDAQDAPKPVSAQPAREECQVVAGKPSMLAVALTYLKRGWCVVPQLPGSKQPCVRWKPFQDRLPTEDELREWFAKWPEAGLALVLGPISNVLVVDVDGPDAHAVLIDRLGGEPHAVKALSGSRKPFRYHLFFQRPSQVPTKAKLTPWHEKLEFRGRGGVVIIPPSLHPSGQRYSWVEGQSLDDLPLPLLPEAILEAMQASSRKPKLMSPRIESPGKAPTGVGASSRTREFLSGVQAYSRGWNSRLFAAACDLCGRGMPHEVAEPLLLAGAKPQSAADDNKARATILSAYSQPRTPSRY